MAEWINLIGGVLSGVGVKRGAGVGTGQGGEGVGGWSLSRGAERRGIFTQ